MTNKGSLNVKDFPFAFSIAVLLFPNVLSEQSNTTIYAIIVFGGMIGSILTITNPFGLAINAIYSLVLNKHTLMNLRRTKFIDKITAKQFSKALSNPSVSYEADKMVGMTYFLIILGVTVGRLSEKTSFATSLHLTESQIIIGIILAICGLIGVSVILIVNIAGFRFPSHIKRIECATILLIANELTNLSLESKRILANYSYGNITILNMVITELKKLEPKKARDMIKFAENFDHTELGTVIPRDTGTPYYVERKIRQWEEIYHIFLDLKSKYGLTFSEIVDWYKTDTYFNNNDLEQDVTQLQSAIDTRDWNNAELMTSRIIQRIDSFLVLKGM